VAVVLLIAGYCRAVAGIAISSDPFSIVAARSNRPDRLAACVQRVRGEAGGQASAPGHRQRLESQVRRVGSSDDRLLLGQEMPGCVRACRPISVWHYSTPRRATAAWLAGTRCRWGMACL